MTVTSHETTANATPSNPSEKLAGWLSAYRLRLLTHDDQDIQMLKNNTLSLAQRAEGAQGDLVDRAIWSAKVQRRQAVRTLIERIESRSSETQTVCVAGMEKWEGRVLDVDDDYFTVELVPFSGGTEVIADFSTDLLSEDDNLEAGDVVYVTTRTVAGVGGPTRTSAVRPRRLGVWTETEIAEQSKRAKQRFSELASRFD